MAERLKIKHSSADLPHGEWNAESALADAIAKRATFLKEHPGYREFQSEIDQLLDKAGSTENRMSVLGILMEAKLVELQQQMLQLNDALGMLTYEALD